MNNDNALMARWIVTNLKAMGFNENGTQTKDDGLDYGTRYSKKYASGVIVNIWLNIETLDDVYEMIGEGFFDKFDLAIVA